MSFLFFWQIIKKWKVSILSLEKKQTYGCIVFSISPYRKKSIYIGDIAISFEIVNQRSKTSNFFLEFDKMWIHGYFHLIGYDHKKIKDFKKMTKKENLVLNYFHKAIWPHWYKIKF